MAFGKKRNKHLNVDNDDENLLPPPSSKTVNMTAVDKPTVDNHASSANLAAEAQHLSTQSYGERNAPSSSDSTQPSIPEKEALNGNDENSFRHAPNVARLLSTLPPPPPPTLPPSISQRTAQISRHSKPILGLSDNGTAGKGAVTWRTNQNKKATDAFDYRDWDSQETNDNPNRNSDCRLCDPKPIGFPQEQLELSSTDRDTTGGSAYLRESTSEDSNYDHEWTPQDSSYGAACPVCGCIPKHIRKLIEGIIVAVAVVGIIYSLVELSNELMSIHNDRDNTSSSTSTTTQTRITDDDYYVESSYYDDDGGDDVDDYFKDDLYVDDANDDANDDVNDDANDANDDNASAANDDANDVNDDNNDRNDDQGNNRFRHLRRRRKQQRQLDFFVILGNLFQEMQGLN